MANDLINHLGVGGTCTWYWESNMPREGIEALCPFSYTLPYVSLPLDVICILYNTLY